MVFLEWNFINCLFSNNGYQWKKQRRIILSTLRNFGLGRRSLESVISNETRFLQEAIEEEQGMYNFTCQTTKNAAAGFHEDLFIAGTETTTTSLRLALLYMIKYPDIQKKVQAETDRVIGKERQPSMADRVHLPYTDAVIHETQRYGNTVPLNAPRMANKDTTLGADV
nr:PREDICTED: cytochrome P450 2J2-like [Lepisosteus oculatus]